MSARAPLASTAQPGREPSLAQQRIEALEAQLSQLSRQNELLLQELNHRVNNNLSVLLGILDREQQAEQGHARAETALKLSRFVLALAVVQRLLTETGWRPLRLAFLCRAVLESVASGVAAVRVRVTDSSIEVPSRVADRIAVILSELANNSLKHCRQCESPSIEVRLQERAGQLVFEYRDSGPGYPGAVLGAAGSMAGGLGLVSEVVRHGLGGSLELANDSGATATLTFALSGTVRPPDSSEASDAARAPSSSSRG